MAKSFIDISHEHWGIPDDTKPTAEHVTAGSLQRIARSVERMEKPYLDLHRDLNYYKAMAEGGGDKIKALELSNASLKGHITRLRKKIKKLENGKGGGHA